MMEIEFYNHTKFESELKSLLKKYKNNTDVGFDNLKNLLSKQFSITDREEVIGHSKIHRIQDIEFASPTLGSLNKIILLDTDYFVVPVNPDAFSLQGIENLGLKLEEWKRNWKNTAQALAGKVQSELVLKGEGLFIGYILNSYNVYAKKLIKNHNKWAQLIPEKVKIYLSERHSRNGLVATSSANALGNIQDYGLMPAKCQEESVALFELDPDTIANNQVGTKENIEKSKQEFEILANNILEILKKY